MNSTFVLVILKLHFHAARGRVLLSSACQASDDVASFFRGQSSYIVGGRVLDANLIQERHYQRLGIIA